MKNPHRAKLMAELRELEHRRSVLLEELEDTRLRDSIAMSIVQGRAANPDPDAGVTFVEVLLAYEVADTAIAKARAMQSKMDAFELARARAAQTDMPIDLTAED